MAARMQRAFAGVHCITATESVFRLCTDGVELDANHTALRIVCSRSHLIRSCETQVMACIQFYMMLWFTFGECLTFSFIISSMVMITCGATNRNITKKNCYQFAMQSILISKKREIFGVFFSSFIGLLLFNLVGIMSLSIHSTNQMWRKKTSFEMIYVSTVFIFYAANVSQWRCFIITFPLFNNIHTWSSRVWFWARLIWEEIAFLLNSRKASIGQDMN